MKLLNFALFFIANIFFLPDINSFQINNGAFDAFFDRLLSINKLNYKFSYNLSFVVDFYYNQNNQNANIEFKIEQDIFTQINYYSVYKKSILFNKNYTAMIKSNEINLTDCNGLNTRSISLYKLTDQILNLNNLKIDTIFQFNCFFLSTTITTSSAKTSNTATTTATTTATATSTATATNIQPQLQVQLQLQIQLQLQLKLQLQLQLQLQLRA